METSRSYLLKVSNLKVAAVSLNRVPSSHTLPLSLSLLPRQGAVCGPIIDDVSFAVVRYNMIFGMMSSSR